MTTNQPPTNTSDGDGWLANLAFWLPSALFAGGGLIIAFVVFT